MAVKSRTSRVVPGFSWNPDTLRYRDRQTGRYVTTNAVRLAVRKVIRDSATEMIDVSEQMARGELSVGDWQARMAGEIKNLHLSGAMAGQGGPANMTRADYLRVGRRLKFEYRRLKLFARAVADGKMDENAIRARVQMYVRGMNGSHEDGRRAAAIAGGFTEERNVLGHLERHCATGERPGCPEQTKLGWVSIGQLTPIGNRTCLSHCRCSYQFRKPKRPFL